MCAGYAHTLYCFLRDLNISGFGIPEGALGANPVQIVSNNTACSSVVPMHI
jgi:hypothetical protein